MVSNIRRNPRRCGSVTCIYPAVIKYLYFDDELTHCLQDLYVQMILFNINCLFSYYNKGRKSRVVSIPFLWDIILPESTSYIDALVQERRTSIAKALELRLSCINPSTWRISTKYKCNISVVSVLQFSGMISVLMGREENICTPNIHGTVYKASLTTIFTSCQMKTNRL